MYAEASTVLRAVAADFFFNCWYLKPIWTSGIQLWGTACTSGKEWGIVSDWAHLVLVGYQ
jgi:hypothetical protein